MKTCFPALTLLLLLTGTFPLTAQNELKPAKNVVTLREVFSKSGYPTGNQRYGSGFWGGVDLNGDSIGDFAIHQGSTNQWFFYAGSPEPDTAAMWVVDGMTRTSPLFGDFLGTGEPQFFFRGGWYEEVDGFGYTYDISYLFDFTDTGLSSEPTMVMDWGKQDPPVVRYIRDIQMADLNRDNFDDLLITMSGHVTGRFPDNPVRVRALQIWIHLGGPDFSLNEPDIIVYDTIVEPTNVFSWDVQIDDFDGDGYTDMLCGGAYHGVGDLLRFRWGDANSPQSWTERDFDRDIRLEHGKVGINTMGDLAIFDVNGDGVADLGSFEYEDLQGNRIYLSGEGKDFRTRSFSIEDADVFYPNGRLLELNAGPLNDSSGRFDMMMLLNSYIFPAPTTLWLVSGSSTGPDFDYDARYSQGQYAPPFGRDSRWVNDVTGDGWADFLGGDDAVANGAGTGLVLAGGPYIPFDDPTVSVREEPVAGVARGLFLWPNPVVNELHIAWRGDLRQMPDRFEIYSATGELVVEADATGSFGEMLWNCAGVPAGSYRLVIYDRENSVIASAPIVIQR